MTERLNPSKGCTYDSIDENIAVATVPDPLPGVKKENVQRSEVHFHALTLNVQHLLLEDNVGVNEDVLKMARLYGPDHHLIARRNIPNVHCVEEGADVPGIFEGYGLQKDVFAVYRELSVVPTVLFVTGGVIDREFIVRLASSVVRERRVYRGYDDVDPRKTLEKVLDVVTTLPEEFAVGSKGLLGKGFDDYCAEVRGYELLCPNVRMLRDQLVGRKLVLVSKSQAKRMSDALRGVNLQEPLPWGVYVRTLGEEASDLAERIERIVHSS